MKRRWFVAVSSVLALSLTACFGGPSVEKGEKLLDKEEYEKAIEVFEQVIDEDETNYDAWFGILDAQMEDDEYEDAADTLGDLFEIIEDNYEDSGNSDEEDEDKDAVDYEDVLDDFLDYAADILEEEDLGSWYYELQPASVDLYQYDYGYYAVGDIITLEVPKGMDIYYNFDDKEVSTDDTKYKDGIELTKEGESTLRVAAFNKFGMKSTDSYAYVTVSVAPDVPTTDIASGTYPSPLIVKFAEYDENKYTIYYTIDGSDPITGSYYYYYPEDGIRMGEGEQQLRAVMYDYNSGMYSDELTLDFVVTPMAAPTIDKQAGTYPGPLKLVFGEIDPDNQTIYYTIDGSDPTNYGWWYDPSYGLELTAGTYTLKACIYDYYTGEYGEILTVEYIVQ